MRSRRSLVPVVALRSRRSLVPVVALLVVLAGCSRSGTSRGEVVDAYRRELVAQGVREDQARCLTDRFFAELSDDEVKGFQAREELTDAERVRFAELADVCASPGG